LIDSANYLDFDSAIRRFESSRPSQPVRSLRCDFQVWENRRHSRAGGKDTGGAPTLIKNGKIVVYGLTKSGKKKGKTRAIQNAEEASTVMHRVDAWLMIQRRSAELGIKVKIGCHTLRATGITAYLEAGGTAMHRVDAWRMIQRGTSLPRPARAGCSVPSHCADQIQAAPRFQNGV
jgi:hypothetical protein